MLAKEHGLIADLKDDCGVEGEGRFCTDNGITLDHGEVQKILACLERIKTELTTGTLMSKETFSVADIFKEEFSQNVFMRTPSQLDDETIWSIFRWFKLFETIDNASYNNLNDVSALSYTEWKECGGVALINFKDGYKSVFPLLTNHFPNELIRLNKSARKVIIDPKTSKGALIEVQCDGESFYSNHVIVTASIGFLKKHKQDFFIPSLPFHKHRMIESIGYGTINKIYLQFEHVFWKPQDRGFQLIWTRKHPQFPEWVYDITGFDVMRGHRNVLLGWIGGQGGRDIENETDEQVSKTCTNILKLFLPNEVVTEPISVVCSRWFTNEFTCGSYSYRTLNYEKNRLDLNDLIEPLRVKVDGDIEWPAVLFAGEACDSQFFSTTHGAFQSGVREAERLINFYEKLKCTKSAKL